MDIECPRCGSSDVTEIDIPNRSSLREYECNAECRKETGGMQKDQYYYFQYERSDGLYSWPFTALYTLHEDELKEYRNGKVKPAII